MRSPNNNNKDIVYTQENDIYTGKRNSDANKTKDVSAGGSVNLVTICLI
jgi:hypothetical protein